MKYLASIALGVLLSFPAFSMATEATAREAKPGSLIINTDTLESQSNRYYRYNFGSVRVNWSEWADFWLRNNGNYPVNVRSVYVYGSAYRGWSDCPYYLYPGQSCLTRVEFRPWHEGYEAGRLRFSLSGGNIYIDLTGWGVRY